MKKLLVIAVCCVPVLVFAMNAQSADRKNPSAAISPMTLEQIIKHLKLDGGNIIFEFDEPVYMNMQITSKAKMDKPEEVEDFWSEASSSTYAFTYKIETIDTNPQDHGVVHRAVSMHQAGGGHSSGFRYNAYFSNEFRRSIQRTLGGSTHLAVSMETPLEIFYIANTDAPKDQFFLYTILFSRTRPEKVVKADADQPAPVNQTDVAGE